MTDHNHPPFCCCHGQSPTPASQRPCPACPNHGGPINTPERECPHCHQAPDRPHTDYCPTLTGCPKCGSYRIDGQPPVLHRPSCTREDPLASNVQVQPATLAPEHRELLTRMRDDAITNGDHQGARDLTAALTTQATATTSTPPTQTRQSRGVDCPSCYRLLGTTPQERCGTPELHTAPPLRRTPGGAVRGPGYTPPTL